MIAETWEDRYKRAVGNFVGVSEDVPPSDITITVRAEDGYSYSEWTYADAEIEIIVRWPQGLATIEGPERVADLMRSFIVPPTISEANR